MPKVKSLRVSQETHAALMRYTEGIGPVSVDYVLGELLAVTTVHIPLSAKQRERWDAEASACGMTTAAYAKQRVEFALQLGTDQTTIHVMYQLLQDIGAALLPGKVPARRPLGKRTAPQPPKEDT